MAAKKSNKSEFLKFRCEEKLKAEAQAVAERHDVPLSVFIRAAIWDLAGSDADVVESVIEMYQSSK